MNKFHRGNSFCIIVTAAAASVSACWAAQSFCPLLYNLPKLKQQLLSSHKICLHELVLGWGMKALTSAVVGGGGGGDRLLDAAIDDNGYEW